MTEESTQLQASIDGPIAHLWLDDPDRLNPLSPATLDAIAERVGDLDARPGVRVIVIGGRGRAFCAGADVSAFAEGSTDRRAADAGRRMADAVEAVDAVTIARVHGHCVGGGIVLAAACDLRIAAESTRFSIPEVDLGIPLAWGGVPRLLRELGPAIVKELVMTCRPFDAAEAKSMGFVNRVVALDALDDAVAELAQAIVERPRFAITATKRSVNAITGAAVALDGSWADADALLTGLHDPEGRARADASLAELARRRGDSSNR